MTSDMKIYQTLKLVLADRERISHDYRKIYKEAKKLREQNETLAKENKRLTELLAAAQHRPAASVSACILTTTNSPQVPSAQVNTSSGRAGSSASSSSAATLPRQSLEVQTLYGDEDDLLDEEDVLLRAQAKRDAARKRPAPVHESDDATLVQSKKRAIAVDTEQSDQHAEAAAVDTERSEQSAEAAAVDNELSELLTEHLKQPTVPAATDIEQLEKPVEEVVDTEQSEQPAEAVTVDTEQSDQHAEAAVVDTEVVAEQLKQPAVAAKNTEQSKQRAAKPPLTNTIKSNKPAPKASAQQLELGSPGRTAKRRQQAQKIDNSHSAESKSDD